MLVKGATGRGKCITVTLYNPLKYSELSYIWNGVAYENSVPVGGIMISCTIVQYLLANHIVD